MLGDILNDPSLIPGFRFSASRPAEVISAVMIIVFYLATFLAFFWLIWGAFQYITAGDDKQRLLWAKDRITWALVGLAIVFVAFLATQFLGQILSPRPGQVPLPGFSLVTPAYAQGFNIGERFGFGNISSLGEGIRRLVVPIFSIAGVLVVFYFLIGAFKYMTAGDDKEGLEGARKMITNGIVGFMILVFIFFVMQYLTGYIGIPRII